MAFEDDEFKDVKVEDITVGKPGEKLAPETTAAEETTTETKEETTEESTTTAEKTEETTQETTEESTEETKEETSETTEESTEKSTDETTSEEKEELSDTSKSTESGSEAIVKAKSEESDRILDAISVNFEGKFDSTEEVVAEIEKLYKNQKTPQDDFENDVITKFLEFSKDRPGNSREHAELFFDTQTQDYAEMDDMSVLNHEIWMNNPQMPESQINELLEDKYNLNEEDNEERAINLGKSRMSIDANKARTELIKVQEQARIIDKPEVAEPTNKVSQEQADKEAENARVWDEKVTSTFSDFKSVELKIGDTGEKLTYGVEDSKGLRDEVKDINSFFGKNYTSKGEDGKLVIDMDSLRNDLYILKNKDKIFKALHDDGKSKADEARLDKAKNPASKDTGNVVEPEFKSELHEAVSRLKAKKDGISVAV